LQNGNAWREPSARILDGREVAHAISTPADDLAAQQAAAEWIEHCTRTHERCADAEASKRMAALHAQLEAAATAAQDTSSD
jgi:hypothetical protein